MESKLLRPFWSLVIVGVLSIWFSLRTDVLVPAANYLRADIQLAGSTVAENLANASAAGRSKGPELKVVPGRTAGLKLTEKVLEELVTAPPPLRGFQNKTGMLAPEKWLPRFGRLRRAEINEFSDAPRNGTGDFLMQPDKRSSFCAVFVNHDYHFVWIRTLKTGSTSLKESLVSICGQYRPSYEKNFCTALAKDTPVPATGDPEKWWKDYFVFSTVRNPYARFASAQAYTERLRCVDQTLGEGCENPFLHSIGKDPSADCDKNRRVYVIHMREQTSCLFTQDGGLAVDYIAQTNTMEEDFRTIAREINKKRRQGVPSMKETLTEVGSTNTHKSKGDSYASVFRKYPHCLRNLDNLLANEFEDLGYFQN